MQGIYFFSEKAGFALPRPQAVRGWVQAVAEDAGRPIGCLNYIFCSDEQLLLLNRRYLQHDTLTDILTFPHEQQAPTLGADIYISVERVQENAQQLELPFLQELLRVMIHGVLHLLGQQDKTPAQQQDMRVSEERCLALDCFPFKQQA